MMMILLASWTNSRAVVEKGKKKPKKGKSCTPISAKATAWAMSALYLLQEGLRDPTFPREIDIGFEDEACNVPQRNAHGWRMWSGYGWGFAKSMEDGDETMKEGERARLWASPAPGGRRNRLEMGHGFGAAGI
jgi:hypothetical protein